MCRANPYDRDKERMRRATGPSTNSLTPEQQEQLAKLQQAEMQRQLQRQQVLLNNGAGGLNAAMAANKKQREVRSLSRFLLVLGPNLHGW